MAEVPVSILLTLYGRCFKGSVERLNGQRRTSGAPVAAPAAEPMYAEVRRDVEVLGNHR